MAKWVPLLKAIVWGLYLNILYKTILKVLFLFFVRRKVIIMENESFIDRVSGNWISNGCKVALMFFKNRLQYPYMTSSSIWFGFTVLFLSSLITGPRFMSISRLFLELWNFSFIEDWKKIWRSEITPSDVFSIPRDRSDWVTPNLTLMFLIKCYWILLNVRFITHV